MDFKEYFTQHRQEILDDLEKRYGLLLSHAEIIYSKSMGQSNEDIAKAQRISVSSVKKVVRDFRLKWDGSQKLNRPIYQFVHLVSNDMLFITKGEKDGSD